MNRTTRLLGAVTGDEDMYLVRDTGPASAIDRDFVAASRNHMDALLDEIDRLRGELNYHDGQPGVFRTVNRDFGCSDYSSVVMCFRWLELSRLRSRGTVWVGPFRLITARW